MNKKPTYEELEQKVKELEEFGRELKRLKGVEEKLHENEEHHRSFTESAKGFIVYRLEVDPENYFSGRLVFVSPGI